MKINKVLTVKQRKTRWKELSSLGVGELLQKYIDNIQKENNLISISYMPDITDFDLPIGFEIRTIQIKDRCKGVEEDEIECDINFDKNKTWLDVWKKIDEILLQQTRVVNNGDWLPLMYNMWFIPIMWIAPSSDIENVLLIDAEIHHVT